MPDESPARRPPPTRSRKLIELTVDEMARIALAFSRSGRFTISERGQQKRSMSTEECFVLILAGQELGVGPSQSVMGIKMIEGRPEISANLLAGMVKNSGVYDFRTSYGSFENDDETWCEVAFFAVENGESLGVSRFSKADAIQANLWKNNYLTYPRNMLFARALSNGVRWFAPDATMVATYVDGETGGDETVPQVSPTDDQGQLVEPKANPDAQIGSGVTPEPLPPEVIALNEEREASIAEVVEEKIAETQVEVEVPRETETAHEEMERLVAQEATIFDPETEPPPPVVTSSPQVRVASAAQVGLMHVRAQAANLDKDAYRAVLERVAGVKHTNQVPFDRVNDVLAALGEAGPA